MPKLVDLPQSIRVGPIDFAIVDMNHREAKSRGRRGEFHSMTEEIRIDPSLPPVQRVETLLHEVEHALWWVANIEEHDSEERIVTTISGARTALFRDNPWLTTWIAESLA